MLLANVTVDCYINKREDDEKERKEGKKKSFYIIAQHVQNNYKKVTQSSIIKRKL